MAESTPVGRAPATTPRRPGRPATGKTPTRSMRLGQNYDKAKAKAEANGETITAVVAFNGGAQGGEFNLPAHAR